ncbi:MAG: cysteine hydrolase [Gammaproteobacteria bacterium]|nr:cysteine hydrolase [Gammaproteobacteria bacterium]NIR84994.1 cysteine hydrolase [Gammaproteobacteria bacterium]NIR88261.1 cysteine hydrolase [Gammaproteobacteria bacterium]NIU06041.1 cysteine hydrolase [Gammaproteobacteria bacterium]NIV73460.1 isochorismatase family protein [Gammaproteobacteria bacterium]
MEPPILEGLEERLDPAHTALLIIDMQKDFCVEGFAASTAGRPLAPARSIIPRLRALLHAARETGVLVGHVGFWTLPDHLSDSGPWLAQRRRSTYASDTIAVAGSEGAEFIDELAPADDEIKVLKHRYSAFKGTNLDIILRAHDIRTVVPTGISTNVCVESTLRDAFEHTYYVCVPEDACASWDMELHAATLKTADARFGLITKVDEVTAIWRNKAGRTRTGRAASEESIT